MYAIRILRSTFIVSQVLDGQCTGEQFIINETLYVASQSNDGKVTLTFFENNAMKFPGITAAEVYLNFLQEQGDVNNVKYGIASLGKTN